MSDTLADPRRQPAAPLELPRRGRPEQPPAARRQDRRDERDAGEEHHEDRDRDRRSEDLELAELGQPERGEGDHDGQRRRCDDGRDPLPCGRGRLLALVAGAQPLTEAERHEQEVVDSDPDQDRRHQGREAGVDLVTESRRGEDDESARPRRNRRDRHEGHDRGEHAAEEHDAQQDHRRVQQRLLQSARGRLVIDLVGGARDPSGETDGQAGPPERRALVTAELLERLLHCGILVVPAELNRREQVRAMTSERSDRRLQRTGLSLGGGHVRA